MGGELPEVQLVFLVFISALSVSILLKVDSAELSPSLVYNLKASSKKI